MAQWSSTRLGGHLRYPGTIAASGFVVSFAIFIGYVGSGLTFYAEDYDIILNQSQSGIGALLLGNGGHWGPLSRSILLIETLLFGNWYAGYIALNGALLATGLLLFAYPLRSTFERSVWVYVSLLPLAFVPGVMAVLLLASNLSWPLSFALAGAAAAFAFQGRLFAATGLIVASGLAMSGLVIFWTLLAIGVTGAGLANSQDGQRSLWRRFSILAILLATSIAVIGRIAASVWYSPYFSTYFPQGEGTSVLPSLDLLTIGSTWVVLIASWTISASWPAAMAISSDLPTRIAFLIIDFPFLLIGAWALIIAVFILSLIRIRSRNWTACVLLTASPALLWAAAIVLLRPGQEHANRYAFIWLPSLAIVLFLLARSIRPDTSLNLRPISVLYRVALVSSAIALTVTLPSSAIKAANDDRPRWNYSKNQLIRAEQCRENDNTWGDPRISPYPTERHLCDLTLYLNGVSLVGPFTG